MKAATGGVAVLGLVVAALPCGRLGAEEQAPPQAKPAAAHEEKVDGYAEWRAGRCIVSDGQKVCPAPGFKFKGEGQVKDLDSVPLGYELKARGRRLADGSLLADEIDVKPNASALFEKEVRAATDEAEARAKKFGRFMQGEGPKEQTIGKLYESGPQVERVRGIVDTLLPPYLHPEDVRIYVIENKEWNAFAMGNYSIYVFTGLLDDMDDDEVAIVLGHELVHATHEHTRKEMKRQMWVQLLAAGLVGASETIDDKNKRAVVQLVTVLGATAYSSGYSREMEDQADRVGLRYAYEAGYDITKGPRLWNRFAKKYGEGNKVANFFFGDHSRSAARATRLEKEIAFNYPEGAKPGGPVRLARRPLPPPATATATPAAVPASAAALASTPQAGSVSHTIRRGMTAEEVRKVLGAPEKEIVFGEKTRWTFPDLSVVFERGKVVDVKF